MLALFSEGMPVITSTTTFGVWSPTPWVPSLVSTTSAHWTRRVQLDSSTFSRSIDYASRYAWAVPVTDTSAETTIGHLQRLFSQTGPPSILVSDNGTAFVNDLFPDFTDSLGVEHRTIAAYHPQSNGLVESWNKEVIQRLAKTLLAQGPCPHGMA